MALGAHPNIVSLVAPAGVRNPQGQLNIVALVLQLASGGDLTSLIGYTRPSLP